MVSLWKRLCLIIFKFKELTQENIEYLKTFSSQRLPISNSDRLQMAPNTIHIRYGYADIGYYIYKLEGPNDQRVLIQLKKQRCYIIRLCEYKSLISGFI